MRVVEVDPVGLALLIVGAVPPEAVVLAAMSSCRV
jgi:hypothetical protein